MTSKDLYSKWKFIARSFNIDDVQIQQRFDLLNNKYSSSSRKYHNWEHITALLKWCERFKNKVEHFPTLGLVIFYHDAIYSALRKNNEEASAKLAEQHLSDNLTKEAMGWVYNVILATKTHELPGNIQDYDAKFLLDIDQSILGADEDRYQWYTKAIRKEYWMYPKSIYLNGRRKAVQHFLSRDRIYYTDELHELLEEKARRNLNWELNSF